MRLYDVHHIDLGEIERKLMNEGQHSADSGLWEPWTVGGLKLKVIFELWLGPYLY